MSARRTRPGGGMRTCGVHKSAPISVSTDRFTFQPPASDAATRHLVAAPKSDSPFEFRCLETLVRHAGKVVTQRQLLVEVWGPQHSEQAQYLRVYMAQLRRKLESDPARPRHLHTEPGVGYRLLAD